MRLRENLPYSAALAPVHNKPMTTAEAAAALGCTAATMIKHHHDYGGYRISPRGPWRFDRAVVEAKSKASERRQPKTTERNHASELHNLRQDLGALDRDVNYLLEKLTRRIEALEKAQRPEVLKAA